MSGAPSIVESAIGIRNIRHNHPNTQEGPEIVMQQLQDARTDWKAQGFRSCCTGAVRSMHDSQLCSTLTNFHGDSNRDKATSDYAPLMRDARYVVVQCDSLAWKT